MLTQKPKNFVQDEDAENWQQSDTAPRGPRKEVCNRDPRKLGLPQQVLPRLGVRGSQPCLCKLRRVKGLREIWGAETFIYLDLRSCTSEGRISRVCPSLLAWPGSFFSAAKTQSPETHEARKGTKSLVCH